MLLNSFGNIRFRRLNGIKVRLYRLRRCVLLLSRRLICSSEKFRRLAVAVHKHIYSSHSDGTDSSGDCLAVIICKKRKLNKTDHACDKEYIEYCYRNGVALYVCTDIGAAGFRIKQTRLEITEIICSKKRDICNCTSIAHKAEKPCALYGKGDSAHGFAGVAEKYKARQYPDKIYRLRQQIHEYDPEKFASVVGGISGNGSYLS